MPSQDEWNALYGTMGGIEVAGERLKATEGWARVNRDDPPGGTDDCGFALASAQASGMGHEGFAARLWASHSINEVNPFGYLVLGYEGEYFFEEFYSNWSDVKIQTYATKSNLFSVRCLKD